MGRKASPRVWRDWYVTEAGDQGIHKLCLVSEGRKKAREAMKAYLEGVEKDRERAKEQGLVQTDTPYLVRHIAAEFVQHKEASKKGASRESVGDCVRKNTGGREPAAPVSRPPDPPPSFPLPVPPRNLHGFCE